MPNFYITFGQSHIHLINGQTFDSSCIAKVAAESEKAAREIFQPRFCFSYGEEEFQRIFLKQNKIKLFPRGVVTLLS